MKASAVAIRMPIKRTSSTRSAQPEAVVMALAGIVGYPLDKADE